MRPPPPLLSPPPGSLLNLCALHASKVVHPAISSSRARPRLCWYCARRAPLADRCAVSCVPFSCPSSHPPRPACLRPRPTRYRWLAHPQEILTTSKRHLR
ncbi:hypothetical protein C8R44DRAFT_768734, partial [Mycena epipterygia]